MENPEVLELPRSPEPRSSVLDALIAQYCARHRTVENFILIYYLLFGLLRRLGLDPISGPRLWVGRVVGVLLVQLSFVGPPLALTLLVEKGPRPGPHPWPWETMSIWAAVGFCFGVLLLLMYGPMVRAVDTFLWLHRSIREELGLRRLIAWESRWFQRRRSAPTALLFGVAVLAYLHYIEVVYHERPMAWGTALVGFMLLYGVGEVVYSVILLALESYILRDCDYEVYRLSPLDSVAFRRAIGGSTQIGLLVSFVATLFIIGFVALLEDRPIMVSRVGQLLLGLAYLATLAGLLLPRLAIQAIVHKEKERELRPLQKRLDDLVARVTTGGEDHFKELKRIKEVHDTIRDATEEVLPLRAIGRLMGALTLPTLTFLASRFGEAFMQRMLHQLRP